MSGLRGPDSSRDAQLLDNAVFPETVDVNIRQLDPIPAPRYFLKEIPLTDEMSNLVLKSRQEIRDVLNGKDDRLLAIVGPCSIHDPKAAHEYAEKLAAVKKELEDRLVIVMRVYFEKPRTTIGWKGLINDPDLDGQFNIRKGMWLARKVLADVLGLGLPAATEWLDPITPQYICDLISWGAIGARNTESQVPPGVARFFARSELRHRIRGEGVGRSESFQGFRTERTRHRHRRGARQLRQERSARS